MDSSCLLHGIHGIPVHGRHGLEVRPCSYISLFLLSARHRSTSSAALGYCGDCPPSRKLSESSSRFSTTSILWCCHAPTSANSLGAEVVSSTVFISEYTGIREYRAKTKKAH